MLDNLIPQVFNLYIPSDDTSSKQSIIPYTIVILPDTNGQKLLLCYDDCGVCIGIKWFETKLESIFNTNDNKVDLYRCTVIFKFLLFMNIILYAQYCFLFLNLIIYFLTLLGLRWYVWCLDKECGVALEWDADVGGLRRRSRSRSNHGMGSSGHWNSLSFHGPLGRRVYAQKRAKTQVSLRKKRQGVFLVFATKRYKLSNLLHDFICQN